MADNRKTHTRSWIPGLILIIIGILIILMQFDVFQLVWFELYPLILTALGVLFFALCFTRREWGNVFPGTLFLSLGVYFVLRNFGIIAFYGLGQVWPVVFIAVGLAFLALFVAMPRDWGVMIPGSIFLFLGITLLVDRAGLYWYWWELAARYWALMLVTIGLSVVVSSLVRRQGKS